MSPCMIIIRYTVIANSASVILTILEFLHPWPQAIVTHLVQRGEMNLLELHSAEINLIVVHKSLLSRLASVRTIVLNTTSNPLESSVDHAWL